MVHFPKYGWGGVILSVSFLFLSTNVGTHLSGFIWQFESNLTALIFIYLAFCLLEFLLLGFLLLSGKRQNGLIWLCIVILLCIPWFRYGLSNDFAMRVSIPALLVLFIQTISRLAAQPERIQKSGLPIVNFLILIVIIIGAVTPYHEIGRSIQYMTQKTAIQEYNDGWMSFDYGGEPFKMEAVQNFVSARALKPSLFAWLEKQ